MPRRKQPAPDVDSRHVTYYRSLPNPKQDRLCKQPQARYGKAGQEADQEAPLSPNAHCQIVLCSIRLAPANAKYITGAGACLMSRGAKVFQSGSEAKQVSSTSVRP